MPTFSPRHLFRLAPAPRAWIVLNVLLALFHFTALAFFFERGHWLLFSLLVFGEIFHLWQILTFLHTVWDTRVPKLPTQDYQPPVDVFITVAGEPATVIEPTIRAALAMTYPDFQVFVLNDARAAGKDNWREIEELARRLGATPITRERNDGFKAGNINNALRQTGRPLVAIFDADHVPYPDFLTKTTGYFADPRLAFVQTPQYYKNHRLNAVTSGAWEQQALFFGPICRGKNRLNAATMCGTNMVIRRQALAEVGGMCESSIAEDFLTGFFLHEHGWRSLYLPEILAEGLAPEDFLSYTKQQFRWARGSMDLVFRYNPLFRRGLTWGQKIQYLASVSFFFSGLIVVLNALIPLAFFFTGAKPLEISTMSLALIFLPYMFVTLFLLARSSGSLFTYRSLAFAMAGWTIHLKALWASLWGVKSAFTVTAKQAEQGNFLKLALWHIIYLGLVAIGAGLALAREGLSPSLVANLAWAGLNVSVFSQFILAALPGRTPAPARVTVQSNRSLPHLAPLKISVQSQS